MLNFGCFYLKNEKLKLSLQIFTTLFFCGNIIFLNNTAFSQIKATTHDGKNVLLFENGTWKFADNNNSISNLELPKIHPTEDIIKHTAYTLSYNEKHEQANWVAYQLSNENTIKIVERNNKFLPDPKVKTGSATDADYQASGYDRGHLAPAADMGWSEITMNESFYYSNMSPQEPVFNRGIWKRMEELIRNWAIEYNLVYVVTGPVLEDNLKTIGANNVSVPKKYYKVILDYTDQNKKGIGFLINNEASNLKLENFAVSIDSVQKITGIDFFWQLPDSIETKIEKTICKECWIWKKSDKGVEGGNINGKQELTQNCKGITKEGKSCKNKTSNSSGYCHIHQK